MEVAESDPPGDIAPLPGDSPEVDEYEDGEYELPPVFSYVVDVVSEY